VGNTIFFKPIYRHSAQRVADVSHNQIYKFYTVLKFIFDSRYFEVYIEISALDRCAAVVLLSPTVWSLIQEMLQFEY